MRLGVLGAVTAWGADGGEVPLPGVRQRALLATLLARRGDVVSTDKLADLLWGDLQPERPEAALQSQVHRLRRSLTPLLDVVSLVTRPGGGYVLDVAREQVDAGRFVELLDRARAQEEEPASCVLLLDEALRLWRGRAYGEFADTDVAQVEAVRLEEARLTAVEMRVEALLALARDAEVVAELEPFVLQHPLREAARSILMRALYAQGRHADALSRYAHYRRHLGEELGLEPSAAMQRLEGDILRQELPEPRRAASAGFAAARHAPAGEQRDGAVALDRLQARYVRDVRGRRIAWASLGTGSPVVSCVGWISSLDVISAGRDPRSSVLQRLATRCRLVLYDRSGCGLSPDPPGDLSLDAAADELEAVVRYIGEPVGLFAMSQAGPVAVLLAARAPELVSRLILFGTYADGPSTFTNQPVKQSVVSMVRAHWGIGARIVADLYRPQISDEGALHLAAAMRDSAPPDVAADYLEALFEATVLDLLPDVRVPALVMHYRRDRVIPYSGGQQLATGLPDARLLPFDGAYHLPDTADLSRIVAAVDDFIAADVSVPASA
jgi:DNA-binding SARP family transcriptional activator/pimeloyl-ACP methyl ester carboxylesterase